jgi:adenosylcobinamide-phosphate synthase
MIFLAALLALVAEHWRPLVPPLAHYQLYSRYLRWLTDKFDGGDTRHGQIAWGLAVLPLLVAAGVLTALLGGVLGALFAAAVLYFTAGFRYFSRRSQDIGLKLALGEVDAARDELERWRGISLAGTDAEDLHRLTIEQTLAASHRQLFAMLFWFFVLSPWGPVGAILYRAASILERRWGGRGAFGEFARQAFNIIDWLPARLTALTFAIAGNFEDALFCLRSQASDWGRQCGEGHVLSAGAGALGVRLGDPLRLNGELRVRPSLGLGDRPCAEHIEASINLVWRGLVVWLIAGSLLTLVGWAS